MQHADKDGGQWELHKLCVLFSAYVYNYVLQRERESEPKYMEKGTRICTYLHISAHDSTYLHIFAQCLGRVCLKKLCIPMAKVHRDKS